MLVSLLCVRVARKQKESFDMNHFDMNYVKLAIFVFQIAIAILSLLL